MLRIKINLTKRIPSSLFKHFSKIVRKEEIILYIMNDKYSVKPDKEYRISHTTEMSTKGTEKTLKVLDYSK